MRSFAGFALFSLLAVATQAAPHQIRSTNASGTCTTNQRKSWTALTDDEKSAYITAEKCLMSAEPQIYDWAQNRWDEVAYTHVINSAVIHNVGAFLPWHRLFVRAHEYLLQTECGYEGAQPYWDETADVDDLAGSAVFDVDTGFGGEGDDCVTDGPFANTTLHITQYSTNDSFCLSRAFDTTIFQGQSSDSIAECLNTTTYDDAYDCFQQDPHTAGHGGVGGSMLDVVGSPQEPLFFLHHTNLDRQWWLWQEADPDNRTYAIGGRNVPTDTYLAQNNFTYPGSEWLDYDGDDGNVTTLNHVLYMADLIANATANDVMDLRGELICAEYV